MRSSRDLSEVSEGRGVCVGAAARRRVPASGAPRPACRAGTRELAGVARGRHRPEPGVLGRGAQPPGAPERLRVAGSSSPSPAAAPSVLRERLWF